MTRGISAVARTPAARRIAALLAAAAVAAVLLAPAKAQTGSSAPIKIPPASLPSARTAAAPAPVAMIVPEPRLLLPTDIGVVRDTPGAGIAMYGALTGKAASATGTILSIFANSGAFDPTPSPLLVLAGEADRRAQALFAAAVRGAPVTGLAVVTLSETGGDVIVFYDDSDAFAQSFPRLRRALAGDDVADPGGPDPGGPDDGVRQRQTAGESSPAAGWDALIAPGKTAQGPLDPALVEQLLTELASETGRPWRVVPPAEMTR